MFLLLLSLLGLWAGPVVLMNLKPSVNILKWVDRIVIGSILFLVIFHVMPESFEHAGWIAIGAILVGALWPLVYQRLSNSNSCTLQRSLVSLASIGILTHTLFDGLAIAQGYYLGLAVILHRLPEGIGIWRVADAAFGKRWGFIALSLMSAATLIGYFFGASFLSYLPDPMMGVFEGLMGGVLLHVVFHRSHVDHHHEIEAESRKSA